MTRKRSSVEEAAGRFSEGVSGKGSKWEERTAAASSDYSTGFAPYLSAQNSCGASVEKMGGYRALVAYASCMASKFGGGK